MRAVLWGWSRRWRRTFPWSPATFATAFLRRLLPRFLRARSRWAAFPLGGDGLDLALHSSVLVDANVTDALEVDPGNLGMRHGVPAGTALLRGPFDGVPPAASLEPRVARLLPGLDATEEALERTV